MESPVQVKYPLNSMTRPKSQTPIVSEPRPMCPIPPEDERTSSGDGKQHSYHQTSEKEATTIVCSNDASQASILGKLLQVRNDQHVDTIILNDLVLSNHYCLLPLVKALAVTTTRAWESFCFVDAVELAQYQSWQELRNDMIDDYEQESFEADEGSAKFLQVMTWQANVHIRSGTPLEAIVEFLRRVQNDEEVYQVTFGGELADMFHVLVPEALSTLIDEETLALEKDIVVQVACGWLEEDSDWMELLDDCIASLKEWAPLSYLNLKKEDASTASILSYSGSNFDAQASWWKSAGSVGNLSLRSDGTSCAGYASFHEESITEASLDGFDGGSVGDTDSLTPIRNTSSTHGGVASALASLYGEDSSSMDKLGGSLLNGSSGHLYPESCASDQVPKVPQAA